MGSRELKQKAGVLAAVGVAAVVVAALAGIVVGRKESTALERGLLESIVIVVSIISSVAASYVFSKASIKDGAEQIVKLHSRPAFRRVVYLYAALGRLGEAVDTRRHVLEQEAANSHASVQLTSANAALDLLYAIALESIATANDAMEDWRDLAPTEVAELERLAKEGSDDRSKLRY